MFSSLLKNKLKTWSLKLFFFSFGNRKTLWPHQFTSRKLWTAAHILQNYSTSTAPVPTSPLCSPPRSHSTSLLSPTLLHSYYNTHFSLSPPSGTFWSAPHFDVKVLPSKVGPTSLCARKTILLPPPGDGTNFPCVLLDPAVLSFVWHSSSCLLETGFILLPSVVFWSLSPHMVLLQA